MVIYTTCTSCHFNPAGGFPNFTIVQLAIKNKIKQNKQERKQKTKNKTKTKQTRTNKTKTHVDTYIFVN